MILNNAVSAYQNWGTAEIALPRRRPVGLGEPMPRVPIADGVRELHNRRAEITYGPGSGR